MRVDKFSIKGVTRFNEEVTVDLGELPAGLIALAGPNGGGKSTCLESPFAALYLEFPTRPGPIAGVCHGKDAQLTAEVHNGSRRYRVVVSVDAVLKAPRTEAYLYDAETGEPLTDGKVRTYQAEVERLMGSPRLLLAAALACQSRRGSFLDLSKADRKDLLAEILDTGNLQRLAEAARERARVTERALEQVRGEVAALEAEEARLVAEAAGADLEALAARRASLERQLEAGEAALEVARQRYTDVQAALAVAQQRAQAAARLRDDLEAARHTLDRLRGLRGAETGRSERVIAGMVAARTNAEVEAADLAEYQRAAADLPAAEAAGETAVEQYKACEEEVAQARAAQRDLAAEGVSVRALATRLEELRRRAGLLGEVPCTVGEGVWWRGAARVSEPTLGVVGDAPVDLAGRCPLLADARRAQAEAPTLETEVAEARSLLEIKHASLAEAVVVAEDRLEGARATLREASERLDRLRSLAERARSAAAAAERVAELTERIAVERQAAAERTTTLEAEIAEAETRVASLEQAIRTSTDTRVVADLTDQLADLAEQGRALRAEVEGLRTELREVEAAATRAEETERRRKALSVQLALAAETASRRGAELADWRLLEQALGRDGIQALEIDAAGPELSQLTTDLLRSCFGERFEVRFLTQVPKADGKGSKEVFDVSVLDHDRGREGAADTLSGGERAVISEAISLALAIYVGRHSGRRFETLWRDETAGALDPENAQRYVAMLRRARVISGAHQVVFVAQQPEVFEAADAIVWVDGGNAEVIKP